MMVIRNNIVCEIPRLAQYTQLTSGTVLLCAVGPSAMIEDSVELGCTLRCRGHARHLSHSYVNLAISFYIHPVQPFSHKQTKNKPNIATSNIYIVPAFPPLPSVKTTLLHDVASVTRTRPLA